MDVKIQFSEKVMGEINTRLDAVQSACQKAMLDGNERAAIIDVQGEIYALRTAIKEKAMLIRTPEAA